MAPEGKLKRGDADKKLTKAVVADLSFALDDARSFRNTLIDEGHVHLHSVKATVWYSISEQGRAALRELELYIPLKPVARGKVTDADPALREKQVALVLLQLLEAPEGGCTAAEAKNLRNIDATVNTATARHLRGQMILGGELTVQRTARSEKFALADSGRQHLALMNFDGFRELKFKGTALTALLRGRRSIGIPPQPTSVEHPAEQRPEREVPRLLPRAELEREILGACESLQRELQTRLVPIHAVRDVIRERFGEAAAAHATFDEVVMGFRVTGMLNVISISDRSRATDAQLRDSITSVGETFFYLEKA
jgi:hypothetical protein